MAGLLVVLEGIEACGKSTQVIHLVERLRALGYDVVNTREPGGTKTGDLIRSIFLSSFEELSPETEVALLLAAKSQLFHEVIRPALENNKIVICDRGTATLIAYQHGGKEIPLPFILGMVSTMGCQIPVDLTFYLRLSVEESMLRLNRRRSEGGEISTIDKMAVEFHERVRNQFERMFVTDGSCYRYMSPVVIDAAQPERDITNLMIQSIVEKFPLDGRIVTMRD